MEMKHIKISNEWCCRWAPSLGALEDTHENVWGTKTYDPETDIDKPCVFFGLYGFPDFIALWKHKGRKAILWAGSDIRHFVNGYWLDDTGEIRLDKKGLVEWINKNCESYSENMVECEALRSVGIDSKAVPSFLGNIDDYEVSYEWSERPKLYTSVSGNNFELYGWDKIPELARQNPDIEFHCYGNTVFPWELPLTENPFNSVGIYRGNIILRGRVSKEQMNSEVRNMQGALRLAEFDGFSEILAKSILWGQYPVSLIEYPFMFRVDEIDKIRYQEEPNIKGREFYRKILNSYPWNNVKKYKTTQ